MAMDSQDKMDGGNKDEYLDVSNNMRLYVNMRFAQLTLLIALTAALTNVIFGKNPPLSPDVSFLLKLAGLVTSVVFWIMEERAADFFHHYKRRAIQLEKSLGFMQYTNRPEGKWITATNAVRFLFGFLILFWFASLIVPAFTS
jgi:hypothetical protein